MPQDVPQRVYIGRKFALIVSALRLCSPTYAEAVHSAHDMPDTPDYDDGNIITSRAVSDYIETPLDFSATMQPPSPQQLVTTHARGVARSLYTGEDGYASSLRR